MYWDKNRVVENKPDPTMTYFWSYSLLFDILAYYNLLSHSAHGDTSHSFLIIKHSSVIYVSQYTSAQGLKSQIIYKISPQTSPYLGLPRASSVFISVYLLTDSPR